MLRTHTLNALGILCIGIFLVSFTSALDFAGGNGSLINPYQITNWTALQQMNAGSLSGLGNRYVDGNYTLMNNLSKDDADYASVMANWNNIGNGSSCGSRCSFTFTGSLNGNNYTIKDFYLDRPTITAVGMFGTMNGNVWNVRMENATITGKSNVGTLSSTGTGKIYNSHVQGTVNITDGYGGGFARQVQNIYNSTANVSVTGFCSTGQCFIGGFVADTATGTVDGCASFGNVVVTHTATTVPVGAFMGYANGGSVSNSYSTGNVSGGVWTGGFMGYSNGGSIANSYSTGYVTGGTTANGGFLALINTGTYTNDYWDINTSGQATSVGGAGVVGKTTIEMKQIGTFSAWNIVNTTTERNNGYPFLAHELGNWTAKWLIWDGTTPEPPSENCWTIQDSLLIITNECADENGIIDFGQILMEVLLS